MRKQIIFILCTGLLLVSLIGCTSNTEQTTLPDDSTQTEQGSMPTPTKDTLPLTAEEIEKEYSDEIRNFYTGAIQGYVDAEFILKQDDELLTKMNIQLVEHNYSTYAIFVNLEMIVIISPGWGSYNYEYQVVDLDEDGEYEMVGYYDWGSGIVWSAPFVLKEDGEYFSGRESDKNEQRLSNGDEVDFPMYRNLQIANDGKTLFADVTPALSGEEYSQVEIYFEDGKYIFELS